MSFFKSLVPPSDTKPPSTWLKIRNQSDEYFFILVKDQFNLSSWLAIGACMNTLLFLAIGRLAILLPFLLLFFKIADRLLMTVGFKKNYLMDGAILEKYSAQIPNADGTFGPKPANQQVVVFHIGARCNHPLGVLGPGFKQLGDYFTGMGKEVERDAEKYGFLGSSDWIANGERATGNEIMTVMYFKTSEGLHAYAHGELHRKAWNWWNATYKEHPHISIWHEMYIVPAGHWETIYVNTRPLLMGATTFPIKSKDGATKWVSPIVHAWTGPLKSSRGRLTMTDGQDNDKFEDIAYSESDVAAAKAEFGL